MDILLQINNDTPISYKEFYEANTAKDVEPLSNEEFEAIKNLKVGESYITGHAAGIEIKRIS